MNGKIIDEIHYLGMNSLSGKAVYYSDFPGLIMVSGKSVEMI